MKKLFIFLLMVITSLVVFNTCTPAQPKSDYILPWQSEIHSAKYFVFFEEGTSPNPASYSLVDGMDYKLASLIPIDSVDAPNTQLLLSQLDNNGEYIVFGVVGVSSDGLYGPMGVQTPFQKPTVPSKPITLPPVRVINP